MEWRKPTIFSIRTNLCAMATSDASHCQIVAATWQSFTLESSIRARNECLTVPKLVTTYFDTGSSHVRFCIVDRVLTEVEDARRQDRISSTFNNAIDEVVECSNSARSDNGNPDRVGYSARQRDIKPVFGSIPIHTREQNFTSS